MSQSYYRLHMQTLSQQNLTSLIFLTESNRNKLWYPERIICFLIRFWRNLKKCTFCKPSASYLILWDSWLVKTTFSQWNGSFLIYILIPGSFSSCESFCLEIIFYDLNLLGSASQRVSESMDALFASAEFSYYIHIFIWWHVSFALLNFWEEYPVVVTFMFNVTSLSAGLYREV